MGPRHQSFSSVFERMSAAVAAIEPQQIITPEHPLKEGEVVLVVCDDYLQRFHTYVDILGAELRSNMSRLNGLVRKASEMLSAKSSDLMVTESLKRVFEPSDEAIELYQTISKLEPQVFAQADYADDVGKMFWAELRHRHPKLAGHPHLALRADWKIVVPQKEDEGESLHDFLRSARDLVDADDADGFGAFLSDIGLADLLKGRGGRRSSRSSSRSGESHGHSREHSHAAE